MVPIYVIKCIQAPINVLNIGENAVGANCHFFKCRICYDLENHNIMTTLKEQRSVRRRAFSLAEDWTYSATREKTNRAVH